MKQKYSREVDSIDWCWQQYYILDGVTLPYRSVDWLLYVLIENPIATSKIHRSHEDGESNAAGCFHCLPKNIAGDSR